MKKQLLILAVLGMTATASTAIAAPLSDYSTGKVAIDVGFNWSSKFDDISTKPAMNAGITAGLGNNTAIQYKYDNWQSKTFGDNAQAGYQKHQFNLLYQIAPGLSPYVGYRRENGNLNVDGEKITSDHNIIQVGVLGQLKFADDKAKLWGDIAVGNKNRQSYELGAGYEFMRNTDVNVTYQYNNLDGVKVKGFTTGVTYKF